MSAVTAEESLRIELLEESFQLLAPQGELLVDRFYSELFRRHPGVKPLFANVDMKRQKQHLLSALVLVVSNLRNPARLRPALTSMGRRHQGYGAQPEHYGAVASTMISVMAEVAGDLWNDRLQTAWSDAFQFVASEMLAGHGTR